MHRHLVNQLSLVRFDERLLPSCDCTPATDSVVVRRFSGRLSEEDSFSVPVNLFLDVL
jgi:hypothetical protein